MRDEGQGDEFPADLPVCRDTRLQEWAFQWRVAPSTYSAHGDRTPKVGRVFGNEPYKFQNVVLRMRYKLPFPDQ